MEKRIESTGLQKIRSWVHGAGEPLCGIKYKQLSDPETGTSQKPLTSWECHGLVVCFNKETEAKIQKSKVQRALFPIRTTYILDSILLALFI